MASRVTVVLASLLLATSAVVFWLRLMFQPATEAIVCPEKCRCEIDSYYVDCSDSGLNSIPSDLPKHVLRLVLDSNNITLLENDSFVSRGLVELQIINADFCEIRKIELGAFNGLTKLTDLSIRSGEISEIIPGTFQKSSHLKILELLNNKIEHLESDVFRGLAELEYIDLGENNLQYLHPDTFSGLPNFQKLFLSRNSGLQIPTDRHFINSQSLKHLSISSCNVSSVSVETFANVSALELLDLSENHLRSVDINILRALPKLSELYLKYNEISEIIPGTFQKSSHLKILELLNNRIGHLESEVFRGLAELEYIDLEENNLQYLHPDTFSGLPNFQKLFLSRNSGLQIPTDRHFINSQSLKRLSISSCNVSSVSVETFANVSALELLDLSHNNLRTLDINILRALPELSELYLYSNPLHCDCQLQEVWRWCEDRNIVTVYWGWEPECDTPSEVKGLWWGVLEKGQCLEGNIQSYGDYKNTSYSYTPIEFMDTETETEQQGLINIFVKPYGLTLSAVTFICGTTGNVILLIIIIFNKDMRTVPNMYILNLAISDIIYLMVLFSEVCANRISKTWLEHDIVCAFLSFCYRMSVGLSAYSVAVLSIQRYGVIVNPFHVHVSSKPTWRATVATVCGVWIVAALFALPLARSRNLCFGFIFLFLSKYYQHVAIFELLVSCVFPLCVVTFTYITTARHLEESCLHISEGTQNPQLNEGKNTGKIVLGLTVVFLISCVPYHTTETYLCSRKSVDIRFPQFLDEFDWIINLLEIKPILKLFLSINSCLNPVAVFCTSLAFRRQFRRYLTCCCKTNSPPTDFELARRN